MAAPPLVAESAAMHVFTDAEHPVHYQPVGVQRVLSAVFLVIIPSSAVNIGLVESPF